MGVAEALREHLGEVHLADMCPNRLDVLIAGVAAMAARHHAEITGLLAGGSESVVVAARSASGAPFVVKGTAEVAAAAAEAQLFTSEVPSPALYDLDPDVGVLAMEHIDGVALNTLPVTDPAGELAKLRELLAAVDAAGLDPRDLCGFGEAFATRSRRYSEACAAAGRHDLTRYAVEMAGRTGGEWVPLDLHPKNLLVDRTGTWRLIDPMPVRYQLNWCTSKWAVVRRHPGELAGAQLRTWTRLLEPVEVTHLRDAAVWEIGSQRDQQRSIALLDIVTATTC